MCERWGAREGKNDSWILKNFTRNAHMSYKKIKINMAAKAYKVLGPVHHCR